MTSARLLEVLAAGPLATIQDGGRHGVGRYGVGPSGAADTAAYALVNRLLGNPAGAAAIEATLGGLTLATRVATWLATAGAACDWTVDGVPQPQGLAVFAPAGAVVRLGRPATHLRTYLGVRGGVAVPPVLGSRSTDVLGGIGPRPLAAGDLLPIGPAPADPVPSLDVPVTTAYGQELTCVPGPRWDRVADGPSAALAALAVGEYEVSPDSNRVALRLLGPEIARLDPTGLPSEGLVAGAVQIPPDGRPVVFLADHPVTGGYPVVAVVVGRGLAAAAQARPGDRLRFVASP